MCTVFLKFKNFVLDRDALLCLKLFLDLGKTFPGWLESEAGNKKSTKTGKKKGMFPVAKQHIKTS